jgi:hypothetical protein
MDDSTCPLLRAASFTSQRNFFRSRRLAEAVVVLRLNGERQKVGNQAEIDRSPYPVFLTAFMNSPQACSRGRATRAYPFEIQRTMKWAAFKSRPATLSAPASIRGDGSLLDVFHQ